MSTMETLRGNFMPVARYLRFTGFPEPVSADVLSTLTWGPVGGLEQMRGSGNQSLSLLAASSGEEFHMIATRRLALRDVEQFLSVGVSRMVEDEQGRLVFEKERSLGGKREMLLRASFHPRARTGDLPEKVFIARDLVGGGSVEAHLAELKSPKPQLDILWRNERVRETFGVACRFNRSGRRVLIPNRVPDFHDMPGIRLHGVRELLFGAVGVRRLSLGIPRFPALEASGRINFPTAMISCITDLAIFTNPRGLAPRLGRGALLLQGGRLPEVRAAALLVGAAFAMGAAASQAKLA